MNEKKRERNSRLLFYFSAMQMQSFEKLFDNSIESHPMQHTQRKQNKAKRKVKSFVCLRQNKEENKK